MLKTIVFSLLIIIVLNFILHYIKDSFTEPIIRYIDKPEEKNEQSEIPKHDESTEMKKELSIFLSQTMM
jgi:Mn-dependent DtxR family transcriptional regulator